MKKIINVAVLFGGDSFESEISFYTARNIARNLDEKKYKINLIEIKHDGWMLFTGNLEDFSFEHYYKKMVKIYFTPNNDKKVLLYNSLFIKIDICFIAVHGKNGEDGRLQGMMDMCGIPYIGSDLIGSANCYNKKIFKTILSFYGIPQLKWFSTNIMEEFNLNLLEDKIAYPMIVKPVSGGSSLGISIANNQEELYKSIIFSSKYDYDILIEEFGKVDEIDCAMFIGKSSNILTLSTNKYSESFYDYHAKYKSKDTCIVIPAPLAKETQNIIEKIALQIINIFNLKGMVRIDFFVNGNEVFVNEVNTQPGIGNDTENNVWKFNGSLSNLLEKSILECLEK